MTNKKSDLPSNLESSTDRQIRKIAIDADGNVKIGFVEILTSTEEMEPGQDDAVSKAFTNKYTVESPLKPHKDLLDAMKKLRKHALDICEMIFDTKAVTFYTVSAIDIAGDVLMKQSRVIMTVSKEVRSTGKMIHFRTPQCTMYGESEYSKAEEMSKLIEEVISEAFKYLEGKGESEAQLPLFPRIELATA